MDGACSTDERNKKLRVRERFCEESVKFERYLEDLQADGKILQ
jgi:hypothetical protein